MKKITALTLLSMITSFAHTMERSQEISSSVLNAIQSNMGYVKKIMMKIQSSDGTKIAVLDSDGTVSLWDKSGKLLDAEVAKQLGKILSLEFSSNETKVIVTTSTGPREYAIVDAHALKMIKEDMGLYKKIMMKIQNSDGTKIAILDDYGTVSLWNKSGKVINPAVAKNLTIKDVLALEFSKDGEDVIIKTAEGGINPAALEKIKSKMHYLLSIKMKDVSPDGTKLVIFDSVNDISVWDAETGNLLIARFPSNLGNIKSVKFNEDGTKIIATTFSGNTKEFPLSYKK